MSFRVCYKSVAHPKSGAAGHAGFDASDSHARLSSAEKLSGSCWTSFTATRSSSRFGSAPIDAGSVHSLLNDACVAKITFQHCCKEPFDWR